MKPFIVFVAGILAACSPSVGSQAESTPASLVTLESMYDAIASAQTPQNRAAAAATPIMSYYHLLLASTADDPLELAGYTLQDVHRQLLSQSNAYEELAQRYGTLGAYLQTGEAMPSKAVFVAQLKALLGQESSPASMGLLDTTGNLPARTNARVADSGESSESDSDPSGASDADETPGEPAGGPIIGAADTCPLPTSQTELRRHIAYLNSRFPSAPVRVGTPVQVNLTNRPQGPQDTVQRTATGRGRFQYLVTRHTPNGSYSIMYWVATFVLGTVNNCLRN